MHQYFGEIIFALQIFLLTHNSYNLDLKTNIWDIATTVSAALATIGTFAAVSFALYQHYKNNASNKSAFYLTQTKENFSRAISLLATADKNNLKWHQAIDLLKISDNHLKPLITLPPHQIIYLTTYIDTAYTLMKSTKEIKDFHFFYGEPDYIVKPFLAKIRSPHPGAITNSTTDEKFYLNNSRISPDSLEFLCVFFDKAKKAMYEINDNKKSLESVYNSDHFKKTNDGDLENPCFFTSDDRFRTLIKEYIQNYQFIFEKKD